MMMLMSYQPTMTVLFASVSRACLRLVEPATARCRLLVGSLELAVWQLLFEIYDPKTGFRMPWIQTQLQNLYPLPGAG